MTDFLLPNTILDDPGTVRHIIEGEPRVGEDAVALCGVRWRVRQVHARGVLTATCPECQEKFMRNH